MTPPLQIAFHNLPSSFEIESKIRAEAERLDEDFGPITSCRVVVDIPHRRNRDENTVLVRINLKGPGREVVVNREPGSDGDHRDPEAAIRDAFAEARRQLEQSAHIRRGDVKAHKPAAHGRVLRLIADEGYGFLETPDGREIYFHKNAVHDGDFDRLRPGTEVAFAEEEGDKGPQATTVRPVGRHGHL